MPNQLRYLIDLTEEWDKYQQGIMSIEQVSRNVADKLEQLPISDSEKARLVRWFQNFSGPPHKFDILMEFLYDWADVNDVQIDTLGA